MWSGRVSEWSDLADSSIASFVSPADESATRRLMGRTVWDPERPTDLAPSLWLSRLVGGNPVVLSDGIRATLLDMVPKVTAARSRRARGAEGGMRQRDSNRVEECEVNMMGGREAKAGAWQALALGARVQCEQ